MTVKRLLLITALIGGAAGLAGASNTMDLRGVTYNVDTVFHAKVGPGTTQTQLRLTASSNPLDVYYLTVDRSVPGVTIRSVCAKDMVAGTATTTNMAKSHTKAGEAFFAGCNADFFTTSGTATNGTSKVGSPSTACTVDREIYKTGNSNYQFSVDVNNVARVCRLNYYTGTATLADKVTLFKGVNVLSPANGITLYTPRYWGSANQNDYAGAIWQVAARMVDGDQFVAGGTFRLEVTSEPDSLGDMKIPTDGYIISGRGTSTSGCNTSALDFVGALKPGDIVTFVNTTLTPEGESIQPVTVVSGNPKNVGGGATLDTEGERGDASARHPRTSIGVSQTGDSIFMMVIDGRIPRSVGVTTSMLADVMRYAGAYEAVNLDGGGSSTLYTQALGVRNHCSDGWERAVGNAVFAVLEAPDDDQIAEIRFADWRKTMPALGVYTPTIYAYNKYGKMVSNNLKGYSLSCEGGHASDDGQSLVATAGGYYPLIARYGDLTASIPLTVGSVDNIAARYTDIVLDASRVYSVELQSMVDEQIMPVEPSLFTWTTSDPAVVSVDEQGRVRGLKEGTATVTAGCGDVKCTVNVTVQTVDAKVLPVDMAHDPAGWTVTTTGVNKPALTAIDNGLAFDFTLSSTRGPSVTAKFNQPMRSLPIGVQIRINPTQTKVSKVTVNLKAANGARAVSVARAVDLEADKETVLTFTPDEFEFDPAGDIGIYPIEFASVGFAVSGATKTDYRVEIPGIEALYDDASLGGIADITVDADARRANRWYNLQGQPVTNPAAPGVYIAPNGDKRIIR